MTDMTPVDIRYTWYTHGTYQYMVRIMIHTWYTHDTHMVHTCIRAFVCDVSVVVAVSFGFAWVHSWVQAPSLVLQAQAILQVL